MKTFYLALVLSCLLTLSVALDDGALDRSRFLTSEESQQSNFEETVGSENPETTSESEAEPEPEQDLPEKEQ